jgi:hypothetical protein
MKEAFQKDELFSFNLDSFVSAARSITLHMQKQYGEKEGFGKKVGEKWNGWYGSKEDEMKMLPYLRFLIKARNYSEKEGPIPIGATRELSLLTSAYIVDKENPESMIQEDRALPTLEPPKPNTIGRWFWDVVSYLDKGDKVHAPEFEKKDIIQTCESIVEYLDRLVNECEEKFD